MIEIGICDKFDKNFSNFHNDFDSGILTKLSISNGLGNKNVRNVGRTSVFEFWIHL